MKTWIGLLILILAGCASQEKIAEHCHMNLAEGAGKLECEDIPPVAKEGETCEKLANNMYYCR